jgi:6-phosphogluconolactonase/glucosamine-6-phosphate isomerase/deaminase
VPNVGFDAIPSASAAAIQPVLAGIATLGRAAFARSGRFTVAVSAAAIAASIVDALAIAPLAAERFWRGTHLFLSDTDGAGGRVAPRALARRLPVPASGLHLDIADGPNPLKAAAYEQELRAFLGLRAGLLPRFDLVVLALGADGRLGGLLPGGRALDEIERLARADFDLERGHYIVTLTPPVIRNAAAVCVVAPPEASAAVADRIAAGARDASRSPLEVLRAYAGRLTVIPSPAAGDLVIAPAAR